MDIQTILLNLKIDQLNAMQEASIDAWKEGSDLILLSPTGSGKTLAYLLPLVTIRTFASTTLSISTVTE